MRKLLMVAVLALVPALSQAQVSLGARLGFAPAGGKVGGDIDMSDYTVKSQIPLQLDLMFRVSPEISLGGYFSYGIGQVDYGGDGACDVADCSGSVLRLGLQAFYTFNTASPQYAPWLGAGFGWEQANDTIELLGEKFESSYSGIEYLNLQGGMDFKVNPQFSVGPYFMLSFAEYSEAEEGGTSFDITNKAMHQWFNFGVRGKFDL